MIKRAKKQIYTSLFLTAIGGLSPLQAMESEKGNKFLNTSGEQIDIKQKIDESFTMLSSGDSSDWTYNGDYEGYNLCGIDQYKLVKSLIMKESNRKEFFVLDIGAGNFKWGQGAAKYLQSQTDIPEGITVHIMGIRGEQHIHSKQDNSGSYKLHEFGGFKIEDMNSAFLSRGWDLNNKIDLIVSAWTLRHLVNPVATVNQAYKLLRPATGIMLFDGFWFNYGNTADLLENKPGFTIRENLASLLLELKTPFLIKPDSGPENNRYMIQKSGKPNSQISLSYKDVVSNPEIKRGCNIASGCITSFKEHRQEIEIPLGITNHDRYSGKITHYGDKELFDWVLSENIFSYTPSFEQFPKTNMSFRNTELVENSQNLSIGESKNEQAEKLFEIIRNKEDEINQLKYMMNSMKAEMNAKFSDLEKKNYETGDKYFDIVMKNHETNKQHHDEVMKLLNEKNLLTQENHQVKIENDTTQRENDRLIRENSELKRKDETWISSLFK